MENQVRIALKFNFRALKPQRILSLLCSWLVYSTTELPGKMLKKKNTFTDFISAGEYLIKEGFLQRTPRGRKALPKAYKHLNIDYNNDNQINVS